MSVPAQAPMNLINQLRSWFHPKDRPVVLNPDCFLSMPAINTPAVNPPPGRYYLYMKADGCLYILDSTGLEYSCCCPQS